MSFSGCVRINLYTNTLPVQSIWSPLKIFIFHPKSLILKEVKYHGVFIDHTKVR